MDFKAVCDSISHNACVVSVEKTKDGCGKIRIVEGNQAYRDSFKGEGYTTHVFVPNSIYTDLLPENPNFEDYCYRSAVKKELLHSYAYPEYFKAWMHMLFIPLEYETEKLSYCLYIMEMSTQFDPELLASPRGDIYSKVLNTTLQLANTGDFEQSVANVTKEIRKICKALFSCILLVDKEKRKLEVLAEDREPNSDRLTMKEYMDENFYRIVQTWDDIIAYGGNCIIIHNRKGMEFVKEKSPEWYDSLVKSKIDSLVLFPLKSGKEVLGYIWVSNFEADDTPKIKEALEITAFVLSSQIKNHLLLRQLTRLSSVDLLTGLYNRNKLNAYMNGILEADCMPIGLVFLDINGLKKVNDQEGHLSGDILIKKAAEALNEVFDEDEVFRVGGDEFVVILKKASKEKIEKDIGVLHEKSKEKDVSFAVGYSITNNPRDIEKIMREADANMYEDKRKFYKR